MAENYIEIEDFESNFAQVPKVALKDKHISLKAKGLYAYLYSLPKGWKVYRTELLNHLSDGKDSLNSAFKELETFGYLISEAVRDKGQFKGYRLKLVANSIYDTSKIEPLRKNRNGKTVDGKTVTGEPATNNIDFIDMDNIDKSLSNDKEDLFSLLSPEQQAKKKAKADVKRKRGEQITFQQSPYYDITFLEKALSNSDYAHANIKYYHASAEVWSDKGNTQINWLATIKGFILSDTSKGKVVTNDTKFVQKLSTPEDFLNHLMQNNE